MANFIPEQESYKTLTPFKLAVLQNFPYIEEDFDALTNYGLMCKIVEYLNNVISNENAVESNVSGLFNAFVSLQNYTNNYFDNLDVQEEINNKLDEMAEDGSLYALIERYTNPIIESQNNLIEQINNKVNSVASGSPANVYANLSALQSADPDHSKIYVLESDGEWYFWNTQTNQWKNGGVYQATQIADKSIKPIKTSFVDELSEFENVFSWDNIEDGGYYDQTGNYVQSSTYSTTPLIEIDYKKGYNIALKTGHVTWWNSLGAFVGTSSADKVKNLPSNVRYLRMAVPKEPTSAQISGVKIYAGKFDALTIKDFEYTMPTLDEKYIISNILKEEKLHTDFFVSQDGTITKAVQSYGTYGCYIVSLENISQITHISSPNAFSVILDENYNAVRTIPASQTGPIVIANNEKFIAVNVTLTDNVPINNPVLSVEIKRSFIKDLTIDAEKVFYENSSLFEILKSNNVLNDKKWDALGDSITEGPNYLSYISYVKDIGDYNNMNYINKGVSGAWLSQRNNDSIVKKIESVRSNADIITVFAGTNDHSNGVSLGTFASTELTTFYGALKYTCEYLLTNYPNAVKMFITPLKKGANNNPVISGQSLEQFVNAIKEVCGYYGIPVVDLFHDCQIVPSIEVIKNTYIPDQLHPNTLAHSKLISPLIEDKMKSLYK